MSPESDTEAMCRGMSADASNVAALERAIELAFDYRGDVTIELGTTGERIEGYVFDRRRDGDETVIRLMRRGDGDRVTIRRTEIDRLTFSGRDTAAGRSFETWIQTYIETKAAGQTASLQAEPLDEEKD
ncbi:MAG: hypothetical protein ACYTF9_09290 [Planctomycetota bacterium]|jgi:hypothetical protein